MRKGGLEGAAVGGVQDAVGGEYLAAVEEGGEGSFGAGGLVSVCEGRSGRFEGDGFCLLALEADVVAAERPAQVVWGEGVAEGEEAPY